MQKFFIFGALAVMAVAVFQNKDSLFQEVDESVALTGQESVLEQNVLNSPVPVLVDFSATWCGPCQRMVPVVSQLARDYAGQATVMPVDIDEHPDFAKRYRVRAVPTFIIFHNGEIVFRQSGVLRKRTLARELDQLIDNQVAQTDTSSPSNGPTAVEAHRIEINPMH